MSEIVLVTVFRYDPNNKAGHYEMYEVPYFEHMDVIDALRYIQNNLDPSLAFRYSCEEGKCGICGVIVNGKPALACKRTIQNGEALRIDPLPNFPVVRDLVVDRDSYFGEQKRLQNIGETESTHRLPIAQGKESDYIEYTNCVECTLCSASCPAGLAGDHPVVGPVGFLQAVRTSLFDGVSTLTSEGGVDLFNCFECGQCLEICPRDVQIPKLVRLARREAKDADLWPKGVVHLLARQMKSKTLLAPGKLANTSAWLKRAGSQVKGRVQRKESLLGFFVGCQFGMRPSLQLTPIHFAELLLHLGVNFTMLGPKEWCCGHPNYAAGDIDAVVEFAEHNIRAFKDLGVKTIVTGCPGCYRAWKFEYPEVLEKEVGFKVLHASEFLLQQIKMESLFLKHCGKRTVAYHDPCELGRLSGIYEVPRHILKAIPDLKLLELENAREMSRCCGGGGLTITANSNLSSEVTRQRVEEILVLGVSIVVSTCPNCEFTLARGMRELGHEEVDVLDLADIIHGSVIGC